MQWAYSTLGIGADRLQLELHSVAANGAMSYVSGVTVYRNVEPNEYVIPVLPGRWAIRAVALNAAGGAPANVTAPITITNSCGDVELCARVTADGARPVRLLGQGFQHGLPSTNAAQLEPLEPKLWRIAGRAMDTAARELGGTRMQLLSDLWMMATGPANGGFAATPWSNWNAWRDFVRTTVQRARAEGWSPDYWDIWNEPNGVCCPAVQPCGPVDADARALAPDVRGGVAGDQGGRQLRQDRRPQHVRPLLDERAVARPEARARPRPLPLLLGAARISSGTRSPGTRTTCSRPAVTSRTRS